MAIRNCLVSCIEDESCEIVRSVADDKEVLSPFVLVTFTSGKEAITVGNESYPSGSPPHSAVITSFEHGVSSGQKCIITIHDIEGGAFHLFLKKLIKEPEDLSNAEGLFMIVRYGWVYSKCNSKSGGLHKSSENIYFLPDNIQTVYSNGKIMFNIEGGELLVPGEEFRTKTTQGQEGQEMHLTDAIKELFNKPPSPIIKQVKFLMYEGDKPVDLIWKGSGDVAKKGPKAIWSANGLSKKAAVESWLNAAEVLSKNEKGLKLQWDGSASESTLLIIEDTKPNCKEKINPNCIATYIVNGGNCLDGTSTILTEDGWLRINYIYRNNYNGLVACVDNNGGLIWRKITNRFKNLLNGRKLFRLHLKNSRNHSQQTTGAIFTDDHPVLTNLGYVKISNLNKKHKIHSGTYGLTGPCYQALIGTMLGDSHIRKNSYNYKCVHCSEQEFYSKHKSEIFNVGFKQRKKGTYECRSTATPFWRNIRKIFYNEKNKIKTITKAMIKDFTIISLAYLYMDDGSIQQNKKLAQIATCCFSKNEVQIIINKLKEFGIIGYMRPNSVYPRIYFNVHNSKKLSECVAPYVLKEFDFKLLPEHRSIPKKKIIFQESPFYDSFNLIRMEKFEKKVKNVYCISVEEVNNFITHSGVVHNCSPVLEFNPRFNWKWQYRGASGGYQNATDVATNEPSGKEKCPSPKGTGTESKNPTTNRDIEIAGSEAAKESSKAKIAQEYANIVYGEQIEANLVIQGDPRDEYSSTIITDLYQIGIVAINPFHLQNFNENSSCPEFLVKSEHVCNAVLTGSDWTIRGVNHYIKEGSYVTTLNIWRVVTVVE